MSAVLERPRHPHGAKPRVRVNGVDIDAIQRLDALDAVDAFAGCPRSHVVHFVSADPTVHARRNAAYREVLNRGDLNLPDGMPVVWTARLSGARVERLTGTDTMLEIMRRGVATGARHYLYGGAPGVVDAMAARLLAEMPSLEIVGTETPPFAPLTEGGLREAAERIRGAGATHVWVGLGTPKQDWAAAEFARCVAAPVILCVGAAFDFVAGVKRRPPEWMQRAGLEWLGRLASEPRRLWKRYLIGNARFVGSIVMDRPARDYSLREADVFTEPIVSALRTPSGAS